jgi:hypothetical protein
MKMNEKSIQNVLLGAFTFTMGLVVFKIINKHFLSGGSVMASLGNGDSEEVAGAMIGTGVGDGCKVLIGNNLYTYPCGESTNSQGDIFNVDCNAQGSFGCTVTTGGMIYDGTTTGGGTTRPVKRERSSVIASRPSRKVARRSFF